MTKKERYEQLLPQIESLICGENDLTAILANTAAALHDSFCFFWVGFYIVRPTTQDNDSQLVLGPFQGPVACFRINRGQGVCGTAWQQQRTLVVPDVHLFPGHIACSSFSQSEIVVPIFDSHARVCAVLDIDSRRKAAFTATDARYLEQLAALLTPHFPDQVTIISTKCRQFSSRKL